MWHTSGIPCCISCLDSDDLESDAPNNRRTIQQFSLSRRLKIKMQKCTQFREFGGMNLDVGHNRILLVKSFSCKLTLKKQYNNFIKTINPPYQNFPDACLTRDYSQVMPE